MGEKEKAVKPSVTSGRKLMRPMRTNYLALGIHVLCRNSESFLNFAPCVMQLASIGPLSVPVYLSRLQLIWIRFEFLENILYPWSIYSLYMVSYIRFQWFSTEYVAISSLRRPILIGLRRWSLSQLKSLLCTIHTGKYPLLATKQNRAWQKILIFRYLIYLLFYWCPLY